MRLEVAEVEGIREVEEGRAVEVIEEEGIASAVFVFDEKGGAGIS